MYDAQLGRFHKQDRFAEKYLDFSPYQYGANNPIRYIDINGDSLWVTYFDSNQQQQSVYFGYTKQWGYAFYSKNGTVYQGNDAFVNKVGSALVRLTLGKEGKALVDNLASNAQNVAIAQGNNGYNDRNSARDPFTVGWNPNSNAPIPTEAGIETAHKNFISLGHELAHAEDDLDGGTNRNQTIPGANGGYEDAEKYSTHRENQLRAENGLPLRTHYGVLRSNATGTFTPDGPSRLIDANRNSLYINVTVPVPFSTGNSITVPYHYRR